MKLYVDFGKVNFKFDMKIDLIVNNIVENNVIFDQGEYGIDNIADSVFKKEVIRYEYTFNHDIDTNKNKIIIKEKIKGDDNIFESESKADLFFEIHVIKKYKIFYEFYINISKNAEITSIYEDQVVVKNASKDISFLSLPILKYNFLIIENTFAYLIDSIPFKCPILNIIGNKKGNLKLTNEKDEELNIKYIIK